MWFFLLMLRGIFMWVFGIFGTIFLRVWLWKCISFNFFQDTTIVFHDNSIPLVGWCSVMRSFYFLVIWVKFLFNLKFFVELLDHFGDSDKIGLWLPCRLVDAPSHPFNQVLVFSLLCRSFVKNLFNCVHFLILALISSHWYFLYFILYIASFNLTLFNTKI